MAIAQVRQFIELHGDSRFAPWDTNGTDGGRAIINRAGFRRSTDGGGFEFYILPEVWRTEVCLGLDRHDNSRGYHRFDVEARYAHRHSRASKSKISHHPNQNGPGSVESSPIAA